MIYLDNKTNYNSEDLLELMAFHFNDGARVTVEYFRPSAEYVHQLERYFGSEIPFVRFDKEHRVGGGRYGGPYLIRVMTPTRLLESMSPMDAIAMETSNILPSRCVDQIHMRCAIVVRDSGWRKKFRDAYPSYEHRQQEWPKVEVRYQSGRLDESKVAAEAAKLKRALEFKAEIANLAYSQDSVKHTEQAIINYTKQVEVMTAELPKRKQELEAHRSRVEETGRQLVAEGVMTLEDLTKLMEKK